MRVLELETVNLACPADPGIGEGWERTRTWGRERRKMVAGFDCLNSRKNLLHANSRLPIVFIIQDRKADGPAGKNIGMEKSAAASVTCVWSFGTIGRRRAYGGNLQMGGFNGKFSVKITARGNEAPAHNVPSFPGIEHSHFIRFCGLGVMKRQGHRATNNRV